MIAAQFTEDPALATFDVGGMRVRFHESYNKETDRLVYRFTPCADKVELSEEARPH